MDDFDSLLQNSPVYPLRFNPVYKNYLWGGVRFKSHFGRSFPETNGPAVENWAESWEVCDHPHGQSIIRNGPLRGQTLQDVVCHRSKELFGEARVDTSMPPDRFPLLLKYLDANESLSVQVHPDDRLAAELGFHDRGKTEAWVVVDAKPGSSIWIGTEHPMPQQELVEYIRSGRSLERIMNRIEVNVGDCFLIPPGVPHALGSGVMVAEVQTNSDLTFRLFDWNRVDAYGKPRELKIEEGILALSNPCGPVNSQTPRSVLKQRRQCERLVSTKFFSINKWIMGTPISWKTDRHCHLWTVLEGSVDAIFTAGRRVASPGKSGRDPDPDAIEVLHRGDTLLVPAACDQIRWVPEENQSVVLLDVIVESVPIGPERTDGGTANAIL